MRLADAGRTGRVLHLRPLRLSSHTPERGALYADLSGRRPGRHRAGGDLLRGAADDARTRRLSGQPAVNAELDVVLARLRQLAARPSAAGRARADPRHRAD